MFRLRFLAMFAMSFFVLFNKISRIETAVDPNEQKAAEAFLDNYNTSILQWYYKKFTAMWNEATNITAYNLKVKINVSLRYGSFEAEMRKNASRFNVSKLNDDTARQLQLITSSTQLKNVTERARMEKLAAEMAAMYSTAKVMITR